MNVLANLIEQVLGGALWGTSDMMLVDVGASAGIDPRWAVFGDRLSAVGFEPLVAEARRLAAAETRPRVRYEAAFVGCREYDQLFPPALRQDEVASRHIQPFERSSAVAAYRIQQRDYVREQFNAGAEVTYADRHVTLDEYFGAAAPPPNFLKIDTDGSDYAVLLGGARLLSSPDLLGVQIEAQLHGAVHEHANIFSNIDRFLRARGFTLFDLEPYRYSRAALPAPFAIGVPAQTISGQVLWGEALYFRDLAHPRYEAMFGVAATRERALKLCCLYSLFGLDDCAAEILSCSSALADLPERQSLLDAITPPLFGDLEYREYMARFDADPSAWLPQNLAAASRGAADRRDQDVGAGERAADDLLPVDRLQSVGMGTASNASLRAIIKDMRSRITSLKKMQRKLRQRLDDREAKIKRLRQERAEAKKQTNGDTAP